MFRDRLGVSERWACRVVGHISTQRHQPKRAEDDAALRAELRRFSKGRPQWGYGRAHHRLREEGWEVNRKRVERLWREEGLRVPQAGASGVVWVTRPFPPSGCGPSAPTRYGRSIFSAIRALTAG
jgi:transposase InsO family protein